MRHRSILFLYTKKICCKLSIYSINIELSKKMSKKARTKCSLQGEKSLLQYNKAYFLKYIIMKILNNYLNLSIQNVGYL